jgi:hypothetical protein
MTIRLLALSLCAIFVCGCANIPFFKPATPAAGTQESASASTASDPETPAVEAENSDREAALRALPEGTVVIGEKRPGILTRWWQSISNKKKPEIPMAQAPLWIGTIKVVNSSERYVLIDSQITIALPPGEILNSVGNDFESGTVRTTADRVHPFFIADIASGNPAVGDRVYSPK